MSELCVNNNMLEYKGVTYNILQINTLQIYEVKKKNILSFNFLKYSMPPSILFLVIAYFITNNDYIFGFDLADYKTYSAILFLTGCGLIFFSARKIYFMIKNRFFYVYGLNFSMANGQNSWFISSEKSLLFKIKDGINKSINKDSSSINFGNVNIDIANSSDIKIGNIVKR